MFTRMKRDSGDTRGRKRVFKSVIGLMLAVAIAVPLMSFADDGPAAQGGAAPVVEQGVVQESGAAPATGQSVSPGGSAAPADGAAPATGQDPAASGGTVSPAQSPAQGNSPAPAQGSSPAPAPAQAGIGIAPLDTTLTTSDLKPTLQSATITNTDGSVPGAAYVIGQSYKIQLSFQEDPTGYQWQNDGSGNLTYQLPPNVKITTAYTSKPIYIDSAGGQIQVGEYSVDTNGLVTVKFYKVDNAGNTTDNVFFDNYLGSNFKLDLEA